MKVSVTFKKLIVNFDESFEKHVKAENVSLWEGEKERRQIDGNFRSGTCAVFPSFFFNASSHMINYKLASLVFMTQ